MKRRNERPTRRKRPTKIKKPKGIKKRDRSNMALLGLHEYLCKELSCTPRLTLVKGIHIRKRSRKIYALMRIFPTRKKLSLPRNKCQLYATIKTSKPSQTKVCIIYPNSGTLESWKFFNLTIGGYWANTTLVLSTRSFLFLFRRFYLEHVRTVWLTNEFWRHQYTKVILQVLECLGNINNSLKWNMTYI